MPVLPVQPSSFPDNLLDDPASVQRTLDPSQDRVWWVVHTKARQEKSLARDLLGYGIPFYLPQVPSERLLRGHRHRAQIPVFQSYLFLFGSAEERLGAFRTNRISKVLEVPEQAELYHDLRQIAGLIATGAPLTVEKRLSPGQMVRIRNGPMAGFEGTIVQRRGTNRLLIAVKFLQQGVSVEISDFMVEPV